MDQYVYEQAKGLLKNKEDITEFESLSLLSNNDMQLFLIAECLNEGMHNVYSIYESRCNSISYIESEFELRGLVYLIKYGYTCLNYLCRHYDREKRVNPNRYKNIDIDSYTNYIDRIIKCLDFGDNKDTVILLAHIEILTEKELKLLSDLSYLNDSDFKILCKLIVSNFSSRRYIDCVDMIRRLINIMESNKDDYYRHEFLKYCIKTYNDNDFPWHLNRVINFIYRYRDIIKLPVFISGNNPIFNMSVGIEIYSNLGEEELLRYMCKNFDIHMK